MEPPIDPLREPNRRAGRLSLKTIVVALVSLGVIAAVAGYLALSDGETAQPKRAASPPTRGGACPHLHEAYGHRLEVNDKALEPLVKAAAQAGEAALETSGQAFGRPEKIAIELQYELTESHGGVTRSTRTLLEQARAACNRVGKW